ncbi:hypothetical protein OKW28_003003 [Paraburkholderia sp. 40]
MNTDPKKWNPFKFLRGAARKSDADSPESPPANEQWRAPWPDIPRLFAREPWRALEEFFHDPFAGRGALERWLATSVHRASSRASTWSTKGRYCA